MKLSLRWPFIQSKASDTWSVFREHFAAMGATKAGAAVNTTTALQVSTMFACARVIADGLSQVPFKVHRVTGKNREEAVDHPAYWLLAKQPNEWQSSFEFREQIALHLVFNGNAFVFVNRARDGRLLELLPYEPGCVTVKRATDMGLTYTVRLVEGKTIEIPAANMWHLRGPSWNGWMGLDAVRVAREALGLALATEEHAARMFSNGARPGGILSTEMALKDDQIVKLRDAWQQTMGGGANAYRTAILAGGLKWISMAQENDKAQFLETRRLQIEEICRFVRVMPIMIGAGEKTTTYASVEQMLIAHVTHTLMPWFKRVEDSADINLLGMQAVKDGYYTKFTAAALMRGSARDRGEFYRTLYGIGSINPNEIRALEDLNPYDGGDEYRVPLNMVDPGAAPDPGGTPDPAANPAAN